MIENVYSKHFGWMSDNGVEREPILLIWEKAEKKEDWLKAGERIEWAQND